MVGSKSTQTRFVRDKHLLYTPLLAFLDCYICNCYIMGARDLCDVLHQSPRVLCAKGLSAICRYTVYRKILEGENLHKFCDFTATCEGFLHEILGMPHPLCDQFNIP